MPWGLGMPGEWSSPRSWVVAVPWVRSSLLAVCSVLVCVCLVGGVQASGFLSGSLSSRSSSALPGAPQGQLPTLSDPTSPGQSDSSGPTETVTVTAEPEPSEEPSPSETVTVTAEPEPRPTKTVTAEPEPAPTVTVTAQPEPSEPSCSSGAPCSVVLASDRRMNDWLTGIALGVGVLVLLVCVHVVASLRRKG